MKFLRGTGPEARWFLNSVEVLDGDESILWTFDSWIGGEAVASSNPERSSARVELETAKTEAIGSDQIAYARCLSRGEQLLEEAAQRWSAGQGPAPSRSSPGSSRCSSAAGSCGPADVAS